MAFPPDIPVRSVSIGGAMVFESAELLKVRVTITASKSLVRDDTGYRFEKRTVTSESEAGSEVVISLPRTDVAGWRDPALNAVIDVSEEGSYTHRYTALVEFLNAAGKSLGIRPVTLGPFVVPEGDGTIDLDKTVPASSVSGELIMVPDLWGAMVAAAEAAALAAQAALVDSDAFIASQITTPGTETKEALTATIAVGTVPLRPKVARTRQFGPVRTLATGDHNAFAHAVELPNRSYLVAWRKGANHVPSKGNLYVARYDVYGDTAMGATLVKAHATLDYRDPCLTVLSDGRVMMSWFLYSESDAAGVLSNALRASFSSDNGATWSTDVGVNTSLGNAVQAAGAAVELPDGTLLLPAYGRTTGGQTWQSAALSISTDDGATWSAGATVADVTVDARHWQEPNLILTSRGDLLAAIRTEGPDQTIWTARSIDGGATWIDHTAQFPGSGAPRMCELNGIIYVVYRDQATGRPAQRASLDFGVTWGDAIELPNLAGASPAKPSMVYGNAIPYGNDSLRYWYTLQSADALTADLITVDAIVPDDLRTTGATGCRLKFTSTSYSIPNNAITAIPLPAEDFDTHGFHSTSVNTERITVPAGRAGYYLVTAGIYYASSAATQVQVRIYKNGAELPGASAKVTVPSAQDSRVSTTAIVYLAAGDYVDMRGYQDSGGTVAIRHENTALAAMMIAPAII